MTTAEQKKTLRAEMKEKVALLGREERLASSYQLSDRLGRDLLWHSAQRVLMFAALPDEPDLYQLSQQAIKVGKQLAFPRFDAPAGFYRAALVIDLERDLVRAKFGIAEPAPHCPLIGLNQLDLALVPGIAFDAVGRRLGRGRGFYDRLLSELRARTCGVCFDVQFVPEVPAEDHDIALNFVATPSRLLAVDR